MPIQSKDQYEAIVLNGEEYRSFVPAGQEAEYKQYFKKFDTMAADPSQA